MMEYQTEKIRYISHEVKNQLSICDLYTEIIQKYCEKNQIEDDVIKKSVSCIKSAIQMASNSLLELKTVDNENLQNFSLNEILKYSYDLTKVYAKNQINIELEIAEDYEVYTDKNKLSGVIINLVKNACEAYTDDIQTKKIKIFTKRTESIINIIVSNNANPIKNKDEIFNEGYTTKQSGSGLGLYICKRTMEELLGNLKLLKSDDVSTEFCIQLSIKTA